MTYAAGNLILATDHNTLVATLANTLGNGSGIHGYGQSVSSITNIFAGNLVYASDWNAILTAINTCSNHQGNASIYPLSYSTGNTIVAISTLANAITTAYNGTGFSTLTGNTSPGNVATGNSTATHDLNFTNGEAARFFFNAGGTLDVSLTFTQGTSPAAGNAATALGNVTLRGNSFNLTRTVLGTSTVGSGTANVTYYWSGNVSTGGGYPTLHFLSAVSQTANIKPSGVVTSTVTAHYPATDFISNTWGAVTFSTASYYESIYSGPWTVTGNITANGNVLPVASAGNVLLTSVQVEDGAATTFAIDADAGYYIGTVTGATYSGSGNVYTTPAITANSYVSSTFLVTPLVSWYAEGSANPNGSITPTLTTVANGSVQDFTITANTSYHIGVVAGATYVSGNTKVAVFRTPPVTSNVVVIPSFVADAIYGGPWTLTGAAGTHGAIVPTSVAVVNGATQDFTVTPESGWYVQSVTGATLLGGSVYRTPAVYANGAVSCSFAATAYGPWTVTSSVLTSGTGTITPLGTTVVANGGQAEFNLTPATNYKTQTLQGGASYKTVGDIYGTSTWSTGAITTNTAVAAQFVPKTLDSVGYFGSYNNLDVTPPLSFIGDPGVTFSFSQETYHNVPFLGGGGAGAQLTHQGPTTYGPYTIPASGVLNLGGGDALSLFTGCYIWLKHIIVSTSSPTGVGLNALFELGTPPPVTPPAPPTLYIVSGHKTSGSGYIDPSMTVESGATATFHIAAAAGSYIVSVTGFASRVSGDEYDAYWVTAPVTSNRSVSVVFATIATPSAPVTIPGDGGIVIDVLGGGGGDLINLA